MDEFSRYLKKCSKCGRISSQTDFHNNKNNEGGLHSHCKLYVIQRQGEYDSENKVKYFL